jgi:hypothetical protein
MKKLIVSLVVLVSLSISGSGIFAGNDNNPVETGKTMKVSGYVVDKSTGESLAGVKISISGTNKVIYTNIDGYFEAENVNAKSTVIIADMVSYKTAEVSGISEKVHIELSSKDIIE